MLVCYGSNNGGAKKAAVLGGTQPAPGREAWSEDGSGNAEQWAPTAAAVSQTAHWRRLRQPVAAAGSKVAGSKRIAEQGQCSGLGNFALNRKLGFGQPSQLRTQTMCRPTYGKVAPGFLTRNGTVTAAPHCPWHEQSRQWRHWRHMHAALATVALAGCFRTCLPNSSVGSKPQHYGTLSNSGTAWLSFTGSFFVGSLNLFDLSVEELGASRL